MTMTMTQTPTLAVVHSAWAAALDELEEALAATERVLLGEQDELPDWTPPAHVGPLPVELTTRAHRLLVRQRALISQTLSATIGVRQKVALLDKLSGISNARTANVSAYVDLKA